MCFPARIVHHYQHLARFTIGVLELFHAEQNHLSESESFQNSSTSFAVSPFSLSLSPPSTPFLLPLSHYYLLPVKLNVLFGYITHTT
jgi:hypothetical protein